MANNKKNRKIRRPAALRRKIGQPPGTIAFSGEKRIEEAFYRSIEYTSTEINEEDHRGGFQHAPHEKWTQWYDIVGLHDTGLINQVGAQFNLHPLVLEDILSTSQRPKVEFHDNYVFIVLRMILIDEETGRPSSEQISLVLGDGWLISFQEREGDVFEFIRDRLRHGKGRVRKMGVDYLAYSLMDAIVDQYFLVLENFSERVEDLEENLFSGESADHLVTLQGMKREIIGLRKSIWPLREVINMITKSDNDLVTPDTMLYFRDAYDHTIQIIETIESYRDIVGGVQDLYLSVVNNKMNEVMKMLALISTIFLPLSLMAGIYGMNFDNMPELHSQNGYPILIGAMIVVGTGMFIYFKNQKWI